MRSATAAIANAIATAAAMCVACDGCTDLPVATAVGEQRRCRAHPILALRVRARCEQRINNPNVARSGREMKRCATARFGDGSHIPICCVHRSAKLQEGRHELLKPEIGSIVQRSEPISVAGIYRELMAAGVVGIRCRRAAVYVAESTGGETGTGKVHQHRLA